MDENGAICTKFCTNSTGVRVYLNIINVRQHYLIRKSYVNYLLTPFIPVNQPLTTR